MKDITLKYKFNQALVFLGINFARMMSDTPTTNPNIIALRVIMDDMITVEKG